MSEPKAIRFDLPAAYSSLAALSQQLRAMLERIDGMPEPSVTIYNIELAANEIFANIAGHAYAGRTDGEVAIALTFDDKACCFSIELYDTGAPFDLASVPDPDLENLSEGGYGLFLAQSLMDDVIYTPSPNGNRWLLVKRF